MMILPDSENDVILPDWDMTKRLAVLCEIDFDIQLELDLQPGERNVRPRSRTSIWKRIHTWIKKLAARSNYV